MNRGKGKRPTTPDTFVPQWDKGMRRQDPDDMLQQVAAFNRRVDGTTRDG